MPAPAAVVSGVVVAQTHADPSVRALAEAVVHLLERVAWLEAKTGTLAMDDDGK